jgi:two-component system response regulator YesN
MPNVLIVDDEEYALQALMENIQWEQIGIDQVYKAMDADEAKELFKSCQIDIIICDIEMPKETGLQLVEWVREYHPHIEAIFLTGHALFTYAQTAIQLESFDYLLKPVKYEQLEQTVVRALIKINEDHDLKHTHEVYKKYYGLWEKRKPLLIERFWKDILGQRMRSTHEQIKDLSESYNIQLDMDDKILPIIISVEQWDREFNIRDEEIMEYALRNAAEEMILKNWPGIVIQDRSGMNIVLLYGNEQQMPQIDELIERCEQYIAGCTGYFYCHLSCYIGTPVAISNLTQIYYELLEMERQNVSQSNSALMLSNRIEEPHHLLPVPWFPELSVLFELGKRDELLERVEEVFDLLGKKEHLSAESLGFFYHAFLHMVYGILHKNNISIREVVLDKRPYDDLTATRSISHLKAWTLDIIARGMDLIHPSHKPPNSVVENICTYIESHTGEDFNREDLASFVNFNPAYLSRLFKKETGMSLSDYILKCRVEKAKSLLIQSTVKVADIAEIVGYYNISHFTKMFKKHTSLTPQDYRKKYRV